MGRCRPYAGRVIEDTHNFDDFVYRLFDKKWLHKSWVSSIADRATIFRDTHHSAERIFAGFGDALDFVGVLNFLLLTDTEPLRNRWSAVRIVFVPGSPSHQAILECGDENDTENGGVTRVAESLVANFTHPTIADAMPPDQLILDLDSAAITLEFVEKLKAIDDVAYAQPNFIFRN